MKYFLITFVALAACISTAFTASYHQRGGHYKYADSYGNRPPSYHGDDDYYGYNHGNYYGYGYKRIVCEKLEDPENGSVKQRGIYKGAKAVYSCDVGHTLRGQKVRVCGRSGKFSGEPPICEPVNCGEPPAPENGAVSVTGTTFGNSATQSCNNGYILQGVEVRTCQENGEWSDEVAQCEPVDCGPLENPENGQVSFTTTTFLSIASYKCDDGYIRTGTRYRGCQADGSWSSQAPTCEPVDCEDPEPADPNGSVDVGDTTLGNVATYSCNEGYILVGEAVATCTTDGEWSSGAPSCEPVDCGDPEPADPNGSVDVGDTTLGNVATYSCNEGYILVGQAVATCTTSGDWSSGAPSCEPVDCGQPDSPDENGSVDVDDTTLGNTATYSCDDGYILTGSDTAVCQADGSWSDSAPLCIPVDCGPLSNPENGNVVTEPDTTLNSVATYTCKRGFKLVGDEQRSCQTDGSWSGEAPVCQKIRCPKLRAPKYGKVFVSGYYPGDHARYRCAYGYSLHGGKHRRVCQYSGVWSGSDIECKKIQHQYGYGGYGKYHGY